METDAPLAVFPQQSCTNLMCGSSVDFFDSGFRKNIIGSANPAYRSFKLGCPSINFSARHLSNERSDCCVFHILPYPQLGRCAHSLRSSRTNGSWLFSALDQSRLIFPPSHIIAQKRAVGFSVTARVGRYVYYCCATNRSR